MRRPMHKLDTRGKLVRRFGRRTGLTLYEVVLSLAIFAGSISVLAQGITIGSRAAVQSELQTQAAVFCDSMLSQVVSGAVPIEPVAGAPLADHDAWTWSLQVHPGPHPDLLLLSVTVSHRGNSQSVDVASTLTRLIRDPDALFDQALVEPEP